MTDVLHWLLTTQAGGVTMIEIGHVGIGLIVIYLWPARARRRN